MDRQMIVLIYMALVNSVTLLLYGMDKKRAEFNLWRIPERILLEMGWIGGGLGALLGMAFFHHKTKKMKFRILVPLSLIVWMVICGDWILYEFTK